MDQQLDQIADAVLALLGAQARGRLSARVADWPALLEDANDICQLAALAFVDACRAGRIAPDPASGVHTARSVAAYAWGICNRIFANAVRRSRPWSWQYVENNLERGGGALPPLLDSASGGRQGGPPTGFGEIEALLGEAPGDDDSRLWDVLRSVAGRCAEKDIIVTYLLASGATYAEVRAVLGLSENVPRNALQRVGRGIREILGLEGGE